MDEKTLTVEERYRLAEERPVMTPAKRDQLIEMLADLSAKRGEPCDERLAWFKRMLHGTEPTT